MKCIGKTGSSPVNALKESNKRSSNSRFDIMRRIIVKENSNVVVFEDLGHELLYEYHQLKLT